MRPVFSLPLAALLSSLSLAAVAGPLQPHPAVLVAAKAQTIDPSTFRVGHPASPTWQAASSKPVHANGEHPAVLAARQAQHPHIDSNTFIVQPPASVVWADRSAGAADVVAASATAISR